MLIFSLRFQGDLEEPPPQPPPPPPPSLPAPLISEDFADGNYRSRGWHQGYHPQAHDGQLNRSVYQMRWPANSEVPVIVPGTTRYAMLKRLPSKAKELTVAFKVLQVAWGATNDAHFIGTVPAQDLDDNRVAARSGYLANSSGRFYFEPTRSVEFGWGGLMQANYSNDTGWKNFRSAANVMKLGVWHEIVSHVRQNSVGSSDGVFRISVRRRGQGIGGLWGPWVQAVNATFGSMASSKNADLVQSWITVEPFRHSRPDVEELRLCDLRVYAGNQYSAYQEVNDGNP